MPEVAVARQQVHAADGAGEPQLLDDALRGLERLGVLAAPASRARSRRLDRPEQRVGLVDDRDVGVGPRRVRHVVGTGAVQQLLLVVVENAVGGRPHERTEPEEVVDQLGSRQHRPHPIEGFAHLGSAAKTIGELAFPALGQRFARRERAGDQRIGTRGGGGAVAELQLRAGRRRVDA